ncbi:hypothetical protein [Nitrososphaera sp.]|uniref:hypothetical protein n=1 Tax=Nitrososphaera sp. TaxID=1971748 RepID=UPI002EDA152F
MKSKSYKLGTITDERLARLMSAAWELDHGFSFHANIVKDKVVSLDVSVEEPEAWEVQIYKAIKN